MKKILIFLFFNLSVVCINALDTYSVVLNTNIEPSYTIKLPRLLDVSNTQTSLAYQVKGDIYANQILCIEFAQNSHIADSSKTFPISVIQNKTTYTSNELTDEYSKYSVLLTHDKLPAGTYSGKLEVYISLITS